MKRILLAVAGLLMAVSLFAEANYMSAGLAVQFSPFSYSMSASSGGTAIMSMSENILGINAYGDFTYARVELGYGMSVGGQSITMLGMTVSSDKVADSYFTLSLVGKYPIALASGVSIWPALGIEKDIILSESFDGTALTLDDTTKEVLSPLYLKVGVGLDIVVNSIVIAPYVNFGYNLTPKPSVDTTSLINYFSYKIDVGVSAGYKF